METPKRGSTSTSDCINNAPSTTPLGESAGGLAFEVLVESPRQGAMQPARFLSPSTKYSSSNNFNKSDIPLTPESITEKLKKAEERRLSLEQLRSNLLAAENNRPIEIIKIKDQRTEEFKKITEEKLQKKLEIYKENREQMIQSKVQQAKEYEEQRLAAVLKNLEKLEEERKSFQEKINQKLETAEHNRQEQLEKLKEKLQEHDKKIEKARDMIKHMSEKQSGGAAAAAAASAGSGGHFDNASTNY